MSSTTCPYIARKVSSLTYPVTGDINGGVSHPGAHKQLELRQSLEHSPWERCGFSHQDQHPEVDQSLRQGRLIDPLVEEHDLNLGPERVPVGELTGSPLVVIQDSDPQHRRSIRTATLKR